MPVSKKLKIDTKWCKGCGICVYLCPKSVLAIENDKAVILAEDDCIACKNCEIHCPDLAIYFQEEM